MRTVAIAILLSFLAGCATPSPVTPTAPDAADGPDGPIDLAGKLGLVALDVEKGAAEVLSDAAGVAWISPEGELVLWNEGTYSILLDAATGARDVVAPTRYARIYDNGTGLELREGEAAWRDLRAPTDNGTLSLPPAPQAGTAWSQASDDLRVLGVEYVSAASARACSNDLYLRAEQSARSEGCHLRVARDGRAGWTEFGSLRLRDADGEVHTVASPAEATFVENPVFTDGGYVHVRYEGLPTHTRSEVMDQSGAVLAKVDGPAKLAILDASGDGKLLLLSIFR